MDNFDLRKYLTENKLEMFKKSTLPWFEVYGRSHDFGYRKASSADKNIFYVQYYQDDIKKDEPEEEEYNGPVFDPNYDKYMSATQELLDLANEQDNFEYDDIEDYYSTVERFQEYFKKYKDDESKIPEEDMREMAMTFGDDYGQFYGGNRGDYY